MKGAFLFALCCALCSSPAGADVPEPAELRRMLADAADGERAAVLHVVTPGGAVTVTHGLKRPGGPATEAGDRFIIASISKSYFAAAALALAEDGAIALDAPIGPALNDETAEGFEGLDRITLRHLLDMTSGLPEYLEEDYFEEVVFDPSHPATLETALDFARDRPNSFAPGARFDYVNTNYLLAQAAVEVAADAALEEILRRYAFRPAGATRTHLLQGEGGPGADVAGFEDLFGDGPEDVSRHYHAPGFADGGLIAPAAEVARFFKALLLDKVILSDAMLHEMTRGGGHGYGLGLEVEERPGAGRVYGHSGGDMGFVSDVRVAPEHGVVVVALFASADADSALTYDILDALLRSGPL